MFCLPVPVALEDAFLASMGPPGIHLSAICSDQFTMTFVAHHWPPAKYYPNQLVLMFSVFIASPHVEVPPLSEQPIPSQLETIQLSWERFFLRCAEQSGSLLQKCIIGSGPSLMNGVIGRMSHVGALFKNCGLNSSFTKTSFLLGSNIQEKRIYELYGLLYHLVVGKVKEFSLLFFKFVEKTQDPISVWPKICDQDEMQLSLVRVTHCYWKRTHKVKKEVLHLRNFSVDQVLGTGV